MLQLQQRARYSLEEFKRGNINTVTNRYPVGSEPVSPDNDNDELAILGGKTRLVAKIELPLSPNLMERSPNSHNPIVPLPLSPTMQHHMDPSVVEYLHSFGPPIATNSGGPLSANGSQMSPQSASFSADVELSPVSVYGMTPTNYGAQDASSYMSPTQSHPQQQQQHHSMRHVGSSSHHHHHQSNSGNSLCDVAMSSATTTSKSSIPASLQSFPQYFPVFDYGSGMMNGTGPMTAPAAYGGAPILDNPSPTVQRRASGSPEGNMQSTWQDFVMGLQMNALS